MTSSTAPSHHSLTPLPTTNEELRSQVFPFPVTPHDWHHIEPGTPVLAGRPTEGTDEFEVGVIRLAISLGIPPQEFNTTHVSPQVSRLDSTMLEVLGFKSEWWDGQDGALYPSDQALELDLDQDIADFAGICVDWLNGQGSEDIYARYTLTPPKPLTIGTRCHPAYARTHHYRLDHTGPISTLELVRNHGKHNDYPDTPEAA